MIVYDADGKEYLIEETDLKGGESKLYTINEQIQNIAQKKDTLCRRMYN